MSKKKTARRKQRAGDKRSPTTRADLPHLQLIWQHALYDLYSQLGEECRTAKPDKLRFQNDRLFDSLQTRIRKSQGYHVHVLIDCYLLAANPNASADGYREARRLYWEELLALTIAPPDFDNLPEVSKHLRMLASWVEAQHSFDAWLSLHEDGTFWGALQTGDVNAIARATQAGRLARLPSRLVHVESYRRTIHGARIQAGEGVGANAEGTPWSRRQWANILKRAAALAEKAPSKCEMMEQWVWWCYPIFRRYGWNARQVLEAGCERGFTGPLVDKGVAAFARHWITRGLRFVGGKTKLDKTPRLAEFVRGLTIPKLDETRGVRVWLP